MQSPRALGSCGQDRTFGRDLNADKLAKVLENWINPSYPNLLELKYSSVSDAALELGGVARIRDAFVGFQKHLYI